MSLQVNALAFGFPPRIRTTTRKFVWSQLKAERFAAYGPKVDPKEYGLDHPLVTVRITVKKPAADGKKAEKATPKPDILGVDSRERETGGEHAAIDQRHAGRDDWL